MPLLTMAVFGSGHGFSTLIPAALLTDQFKVFAASSRYSSSKKRTQLSRLVTQETRENLIRNFIFDLAVIAVPPFEQLDLARTLVKKCSNLYIEKPAGLNSIEALELRSLSEENNSKMYVGFQFRFDPGIRYLKKVLEFPTSDGLSKVSIDWHTTGSSQKNDSSNWRNNSSKGGGVKSDFLIHVVDYLIFIFGYENLYKLSNWQVLQDEMNRISIKFSGFVEIEVNISRGFVKESFWEIKCHRAADDLTIKHSAPFSNKSYSSSDDLFLKFLDEFHTSSDVRIQSTSQLFDAIAKSMVQKIDSPVELPTINHALTAHKFIEGIFNFSS